MLAHKAATYVEEDGLEVAGVGFRKKGIIRDKQLFFHHIDKGLALVSIVN